ncbi:MAG TPA: hypothetical protein VL282_16355 [Tepidisphaeraceae bacterium]|jgi:hypothetical protein|nr:hypothetical protein [Tepidisphaeraceae bacterium]
MHPIVLSLFSMILTLGCAAPRPVNPAFAVTPGDASKMIDQMKREPKRLSRPVLVIGGYNDPGIGCGVVRSQIIDATGDKRVISVSLATCRNFNECRERVIAAVDRAFPTANDKLTTEVDVVGVSMGGLVARYASEADGDKKQLRIARLFTLSSPLRGASAASLPTFNKLQIDMRLGSPFLKQVNATKPAYPVYPYVRLGDNIVGAQNASPPGENPIWVSNLTLQPPHSFSVFDPRIIGDITRRLRAEPPLSNEVRAPLPM